MTKTPLIAVRVAPGIPIWDIKAGYVYLGSMTNLPMERAWWLTASYYGQRMDFRAATRDLVLSALRCAVDAADATQAQGLAACEAHAADEEYIDDEDGEIARMRYEENRAEMFSFQEDPSW